MNSPDSDRLDVLGRLTDGRAILRSGQRLVEFDAYAYEYFAGRDDNERLRIARALAAGQREMFSERMLRAIVLGNRVDDDEIYISRGKKTHFWTRTEVKDNETAAKKNADVWRWYTEAHRWERLLLAEADIAITDAEELLRALLDRQQGLPKLQEFKKNWMKRLS